jgi:hypothetical protein
MQRPDESPAQTNMIATIATTARTAPGTEMLAIPFGASAIPSCHGGSVLAINRIVERRSKSASKPLGPSARIRSIAASVLWMSGTAGRIPGKWGK